MIQCKQEVLSFQFTTFGSSGCILRKSQCKEKGHTVAGNGSPTMDRPCRCDYRKGFAFVSGNRNPCYCIPFEEDCSCYVKPCGGYKNLSQGNSYKCLTLNILFV